MKLQPQGHALDDPYHREDIKPDALLGNEERSPYQYQNGDNMPYSENKALKQLTEASRWPKFSGAGEYYHMELIDYIDGIFIDVPSIPDYWITARLNTAFKGHASIWYTKMKEIDSRRNWPWWKSQIIQKYRNGTWIWQKTISFENDKVEFKDKLKEKRAEVTKKKNTCHNCGSTDHYTNNCPKARKKVYAIEQVPEEEPPTENSESDSMGDAIREQSDHDQDPRE
ncbi:hypothetical protein O181_051110 [Austropuccinia psidii MF-1]|uniref:CCHC-type domain-containing protein n=1 Tax=Austropuccinia psidii MF-1 TaxID=1389203 RepID=A0A9Q3DWI4_9BASI|nr:hypothetical protein [Austropuccinia psidii MF-1]